MSGGGEDSVIVDGHRLECDRIGAPAGAGATPTLVFLHEGLGCVAMWRDFPARLAALTGCGAFVYSRLGYGRSDACPLPRPVRYMHDEGLDVLPRLLEVAGIDDAILIGHSDGASIALVYAGGTPARGLRGLVIEAPHVFCEQISVDSIAAAAVAYREGDLRERLRRYHGENVDCAFWGWNQPWLDNDFRNWNLEAYLPAVGVPTLAIQGLDDEYGTLAQVEAIESRLGARVEVLELGGCGHSPHRDQPERVLAAMAAFVASLLP